MVQPIDYTVPMQNPLAAFEQAANLGMGIRQNQQTLEANRLKLEAEKAAQARQAEIQAAIGKLSSPDATADDYANISMLLPKDQAEAVRAAFTMRDDATNKASLRDASQIFTAFKSGQPQMGIKLISDKVAALRNSGKEQEAALLEAQLEVAKDDPKATEDFFGFTISQMPGGKEVLTSAIDYAMSKPKLQEAEGKAKSAGFQATIDETKAKWAPKNEEANYRDLLAGIGLKDAQTSAAQASAESSRASAAASRATAGREAAETRSVTAGVIPAAKRPEAETALRKEYNVQTAPFREVQSSYLRVKASESTGAGDIALVYGYMKMLDPGSVVREGEFATAEKTAGIPSAIVNVYNKALSGKRLTEDQRKIFKRQAGGLYNAALEGETTVRTGIERIAKKGGLDTGQIFYESAPQRAATEAPVEKKGPVQPQGRAASGGVIRYDANGQRM